MDYKNEIINIIGCVINGKPYSFSHDVDYKEVFTILYKQNLSEYLYYALSDKDSEKDGGKYGDVDRIIPYDIPKNVKERIVKNHFAQINLKVKQDYYSQNLFSRLEEKGVDYAVVKGEETAKYFDNKNLRTSCDVDFVYRAKDKAVVDKIFAEMGFVLEERTGYDEHYTLDGVSIEGHFGLERTEKCKDYYKDVFERMEKVGGYRYSFKPEDCLIYTLMHSYKHFSYGGDGLKTLIDVYYIAKNVSDLVYVEKETEKLGIKTFALKIIELSKKAFSNTELNEDENLIIDYMYESNAYGTIKNRIAISTDKNASCAKKRYIIKKIFPPYKDMVLLYPILKKACILLPLLWVVRLVKKLFSKKSIDKHKKGIGSVDDELIKKNKKIKDILELGK